MLTRRLSKFFVKPASQLAFSSPNVCQSFSTAKSSPYKLGQHRSNAEELVNKVPVIEVDGHIAVCDGGSGALGHPVEFIQLDTVSKKPQVCKYCGLQYKMKHHH